MPLPSLFYSGSAYIVRHVDIATGNYVHAGPFADVVKAANYISRHFTSALGCEEPTLIKLDTPWHDNDEDWRDNNAGAMRSNEDGDGPDDEDDPDADHYGNLGV